MSVQGGPTNPSRIDVGKRPGQKTEYSPQKVRRESYARCPVQVVRQREREQGTEPHEQHQLEAPFLDRPVHGLELRIVGQHPLHVSPQQRPADHEADGRGRGGTEQANCRAGKGPEEVSGRGG